MASTTTESMDMTTPNPQQQEEGNEVTPPAIQPPQPFTGSMTLKDFSLSPSHLVLPINEAILKQAFQKPADCARIHPAEASEQIMMEIESGFEIIPTAAVSSPFVTAVIQASQRSRTENDAPTFSTSDDPRLDFYFGIMDQTREETVLELLVNSWNQNPLDTLRLLANLRDIRKGKGIRPQYQQCLYWLYVNHPKTLYDNLQELLKFGYWKDILQLLVIVMFDGFMHPYFQNDANPMKTKKKKNGNPTKYQTKRILRFQKLNTGPRSSKNQYRGINQQSLVAAKNIRISIDAELRLYNQKILSYYNIKKPVAQLKNLEMTNYRLAYAREKLEKDVKYRAFHIKIAELYAKQLVKDLKVLRNGYRGGGSGDMNDDDKGISLAAKWTPSLEKHFDRYTLIGSTIALKIAELDGSEILTSGKSFPVITYLARKVYSKEYCGPLRRCLELPEHFMSQNKWSDVKYERVAAKSMTKNKTAFIKHDKERFEAYLACKTNRVAGASLKPVEIICQVMNMKTDTEPAEQLVLEKQWESLVENIQKSSKRGLLNNAVAICDVSGSMQGIPMLAAIGLTLLTMKMTQEPWSSICVTFSEHPTLFHLNQELSLADKLDAMRSMDWGGCTDLQKVFELIVSLGVKNNLTPDEMPKLLFVFTDMEFNQAFPGTNLTNFEAAKVLFQSKGYEMPTIVFWNLRDSANPRGGGGGKIAGTSTPVQKNELGAALISGFAGQTLSYILNAKDLTEISPLQFLLDVINDERYKDLVVVD